MPSARDRLLKGKSAPKKSISDDEAIDAGRMLLNDQANNPEFTAPKSNFELSGNPETEDVADEDVEKLMNMSPMAQKIFKSKLGKKEGTKVESISMENMFSNKNIEEPAPEPKIENVAKPKTLPQIDLNEPEEEIEEGPKIPFPMSSFGKKKEVISEPQVEEEEKIEDEEIKEVVKEEVKEQKYTTEQVSKPKSQGGINMNGSAMEKMMERMMKRFAKQLINECRRQGITVSELDDEEMDAVYEFILDKLK